MLRVSLGEPLGMLERSARPQDTYKAGTTPGRANTPS